jgi:hypothetical protein
MEDVGVLYGRLVNFTAVWYILWPFGICCGHLVYVVAIWYIEWLFGICFSVLVCCIKKNLAALLCSNKRLHVTMDLSWSMLCSLTCQCLTTFFIGPYKLRFYHRCAIKHVRIQA